MRGASPPDALGVFAFVVSFCSVLRKLHWASLHLCFFLCHFLWGGHSASPPDALGVFACVVFFLLFSVFFLCFFFVMFLEAMWQ